MNNSIKDIHKLFLQFPSISTDSRNIIKDSIFFALKGESFDGNQFAENAIKSGAAYAIVDDPKVVTSSNFVLVDNVLKTLQDLAAYHRNQFKKIPVLGITGSNGKTTSKELIASVIKKKYNTVYTQGNFNNYIGMPLTLLRINKDTEFAIIEMGANYPGEIQLLCDIARPNFGLITNVGKAHIEGFGSYQEVVNTKTALYRSIGSKGKVFVNRDDFILMHRSDLNKKICYGSHTYYQGKITKNAPFISLQVVIRDTYHTFDTNLIGAYNVQNILAAISIGHYFDVPKEDIVEAISGYQPQNNRSQFTKTQNNSLIMDCYNANPVSMTAAIKNFNELELQPKVLILGEMRELGEISRDEHQSILKLISEFGFEEVFLCGKEYVTFTNEYPFHFYEDAKSLNLFLKENPMKGKNILIKGSRGNRLEQIVESL